MFYADRNRGSSKLYATGALVALLGAVPSFADDGSVAVAYRNGIWWDGNSESMGTKYVRDGSFVSPDGLNDCRTVDLRGATVTAPFAEGHNHNIVASIFERSNAEYLRNGVFYVKVPTTYPPAIDGIRERLDRPDTVDVVFSMGGVTSPGGHPVPLFVNTLSDTLYDGATYDDFKRQAFHEVENESEVRAAVERISSHGADFVKVTLIYSEDYRAPGYDGQPLRGLHPDLLPAVVRESHARGLTVTLHVNSAADFRAGVAAGVDEIAHLPGIAWPPDRTAGDHRLSAEDAARARDAGIAVVTTTYVIEVVFRNQPEKLATFRAMQKSNLATLRAAGVEIRIGSDTYDREGTGVGANPTLGEIRSLVSIGAFDPTTALSLWIATGRSIFPERRIACFDPGCEASFLVFAKNPRTDIDKLATLSAGVKQGFVVAGSFEDQSPAIADCRSRQR
ncbi:MAG: hypothetical protein AAGE85_13910 [Pseudomonadota bacterium]